MITEMARLDFDCQHEGCDEYASFSVRRTNDELPDNYIQSGYRVLYFCGEHLPSDAVEFWRQAQEI